MNEWMNEWMKNSHEVTKIQCIIIKLYSPVWKKKVAGSRNTVRGPREAGSPSPERVPLACGQKGGVAKRRNGTLGQPPTGPLLYSLVVTFGHPNPIQACDCTRPMHHLIAYSLSCRQRAERQQHSTWGYNHGIQAMKMNLQVEKTSIYKTLKDGYGPGVPTCWSTYEPGGVSR